MRSMRARFHGTDRDAEPLRDLLMGEAVAVLQLDDSAFVLTEFIDSLPRLPDRICLLDPHRE